MKMSNLDDTFDIESTIVPSEKVGITPEQKPDRPVSYTHLTLPTTPYV